MAENLIEIKEPRVKVSGLTYSNIIQDVYNLIKDNPHLNENITDYTSADSVRMLTELFAWITDQLSQRIDVIGNELFLDTVEEKGNLLKMLKIIGYKIDFPECASADFDISIANFNSNITGKNEKHTLSLGVSGEDRIEVTDDSFKAIEHSNGSTFELIKFDNSKAKYDYFKPISIEIEKINKGIKLYEGKTTSLSFKVDTKGYFYKEINSQVIKNSVSVYYTYKVDGEFKELKEVDNFFGYEAVSSTVPIYKTTNLGNGNCRIEFPYLEDVKKEAVLDIGDEITIIYRVGGGTIGNISAMSFNFSQELWLSGGIRVGNLKINNTTRGVGGKNENTIAEIKRKAPETIKNRLSAVTSNDYESILLNADSEIKDIKAYGENNIPEGADLIGTYGFSRNPLDVWLFIIKENSKYSHEINDITDYINDIQFQTLDLNERMNEIYQVNKASRNHRIDTLELKINKNSINVGGAPVSNYYLVPFPIKFINDFNKIGDNEINSASIVVSTNQLSDHDNDITGEGEGTNHLLGDDSYYFNGNNKILSKVLKLNADKTAKPLFLDIVPSLEAVIDENSTFSDGAISFTVGDGEEEYTALIKDGDTIYNIVDSLNLQMNIALNKNNPTVILKNNITNVNDLYDLTTPISIGIKEPVSGVSYEYTVDFTSGDWEDVMVAINNALTEDNEDIPEAFGGFACALIDKAYDEAECKMLVLYTEAEEIEEFYVDSDAFGLVNKKSFGLVEKVGDALVDSMHIYFDYSNGVIRFRNDYGEMSAISFFSTSAFMQLFGLAYNDFTNGKFLCGNKRVLTFSGNKLLVGMENSLIKLDNPIYITGIWGTNTKIELGSFYENIETNTDFNASADIKKILSRGRIVNLYNTVSQLPSVFEANYNPIDYFNSDYEVKITRTRISDQTYFQIGNNSAYPKITFTASAIGPSFGESLFLKVDDEDYYYMGKVRANGEDVSRPFDYQIGDSSYTIDAYAIMKDGYVEFRLSKFYITGVPALAKAISLIFENKITVISLSEEISLRTNNNNYYSNLDFGETSSSTMNFMFGVKSKTRKFYSKDTFVDLKKIDYLKFSLREGVFVANAKIKFRINSGHSIIDTGENRNKFINNILTDTVLKNKVEVKESDIILKSREKGSIFGISIENGSYDKVESVKKMFYDTHNEETKEVALGYGVNVNKTIVGDYYIEKNMETDKFMFYPVNIEKFPLGDLYFHMLEDHRSDNLIEVDKYSDENGWNHVLNNKKMLCVNHVFRQPKFIPFSMIINAKISKNVSFGQTENYSNKIYNLIEGKYNIYSAKLGEEVFQTDIKNYIIDNIPGVKEINIEYLGFDPNNIYSSESSLKAKFNEKLILASKKEEVLQEGNILKVNPVQGLFIKVEYNK